MAARLTGVAIVIPMLNEAAALLRRLRRLPVLHPAPDEVLAVDGGSSDGSVALARAAGLRVIEHLVRGRAGQINVDVQAVSLVCVLHADTLLPHDAVSVVSAVLADGSVKNLGQPICFSRVCIRGGFRR